MADKRKRNGKNAGQPPRRSATSLIVRRAGKTLNWELVLPRCAQERAEDLEEVLTMVEGGEAEIAIDELRWLLDGCSDFIDAHRLLGELHFTYDQDLELARAHFGYAYQAALTALRRVGRPAPLPYDLPANRAFFEAGKGLAHCLTELGKPEMAREVLQELLWFDPSDPLNAQGMLDQLPSNS